MGRSSRRAAAPADPVAQLDLLLARAGAIADGADRWAASDLRADFVARVGRGADPLGDRYAAIRTSAQRRPRGVTLTPHRIVAAMVGWAAKEAAISGSPARVIDVGAGTGRFAMEAARRFPDAQVVAVENDPELLLLLRANLRAARLDNRVEVVADDFRAASLDSVAGPTLFLGNPPYVRHHDIAPEWKEWYARTCARHGIAASRLAGLHLHFFAKIADLGRDGDFGCLITPAEWLDVGYGAALRRLLANGLGGSEIHLLDAGAEAFPGTMTTTAITGFRIGRQPAAVRFRRVETPDGLDRLEGGRAVGWAQLSQTPRWSILVRETTTPPHGAIELGELCRVHRGQVTGNNRVWIAGEHARQVPARFLKPAITRAEQLIEAEPVLEVDSHLARVVDLPPSLDEIDPPERALVEQFIKWAKARGAADGYITRHRSPWWSVRLGPPAPIVCTYMARRVPAFVRNRAGARLLNIAHGIYPREELAEDDLLRLAAALRASVQRSQGRTYSGGLTKFEPKEVERILIPAAWMLPDAVEQPAAAGLDG
jgi:SAM-dependent methyltransferase